MFTCFTHCRVLYMMYRVRSEGGKNVHNRFFFFVLHIISTTNFFLRSTRSMTTNQLAWQYRKDYTPTSITVEGGLHTNLHDSKRGWRRKGQNNSLYRLYQNHSRNLSWNLLLRVSITLYQHTFVHNDDISRVANCATGSLAYPGNIASLSQIPYSQCGIPTALRKTENGVMMVCKLISISPSTWQEKRAPNARSLASPCRGGNPDLKKKMATENK